MNNNGGATMVAYALIVVMQVIVIVTAIRIGTNHLKVTPITIENPNVEMIINTDEPVAEIERIIEGLDI